MYKDVAFYLAEPLIVSFVLNMVLILILLMERRYVKDCKKDAAFYKECLRTHKDLSANISDVLCRFAPDLAPVLIEFATITNHHFSNVPVDILMRNFKSLEQVISGTDQSVKQKKEELEKMRAIIDILAKPH